MIHHIKDTEELKRKALLKQRLEASLAKDIYQVFNSGAAIKKLRDMAGLIMKAMGTGDLGAFQQATTKEGQLRLWDKLGKTQSAFVLFSSSQTYLLKLDATDCADIIRLAGEWVEQGGVANAAFEGFGDTDWKQHQPMSDTVKEAYRPGVGAGNNKAKVENVWSDGKGRFEGLDKKRDRNRQGEAIEPHIKDLMRDPKAVSGMQLKRLTGNSNILKLDRLFGLVEACDISGTTTDTVFALEVFGAQIGLTAGYYLLPLGTIVHNMHHSVLEVATALTLNQCIDYHIGFFSTLAPLAKGGLPPELNQIHEILNVAEADMIAQQLHFLNYYEGGRLSGGYLITEGLVEQFRRSELSASTTLLDKARTLLTSPYPSRYEVEMLFHQCLPGALLV